MTDSTRAIPPELREFTIRQMQRVVGEVPENIESVQKLLSRTAEINGLSFSIAILATLSKEEITGARFKVFHKLLCRDNPELTIGVIAALLDTTIPIMPDGATLTLDVINQDIDALIADPNHRPSFDPVSVEKAYKAKSLKPSRS